jgi:hypothetical protein
MRVFENRVLRRMFGPKWDEVIGEWRRLRDKELYALYSSTNIIRVITSRRRAGHAACIGRGEVHAGFWYRNMKEGDHLEESGVDGRIILKLILQKWDGRTWTISV